MIVVYCADKPIYNLLPTSINSLLINNENYIDKIYIICEDDSIPFINHSKIEFINYTKHYNFINQNGINCRRRFPYMAMVRCFLSEILDESKILYLDVDTIIDKDVSELGNMNLGSDYVAARKEYEGYFNSGVLLMNLKLIRALKYADKFKNLLENCKFVFPDQDAINILFKGHIRELDPKYNAVGPDDVYYHPIKIRHFAGVTKPWQKWCSEKDKELWNKYEVDYIDC